MATRHPNIETLEMAAARLGELRDELVFLGGCATGLLISDAGAPPMRMTRDVDVIAEVASLSDYHGLSARLRKRGVQRGSVRRCAHLPLGRRCGHSRCHAD
jgi:hypothetical protein